MYFLLFLTGYFWHVQNWGLCHRWGSREVDSEAIFTHRQCIGNCPWDQHFWRLQEERLSKGETESRYSCNRSLSQFHTEFYSLEGPQSCFKLWNGRGGGGQTIIPCTDQSLSLGWPRKWGAPSLSGFLCLRVISREGFFWGLPAVNFSSSCENELERIIVFLELHCPYDNH